MKAIRIEELYCDSASNSSYEQFARFEVSKILHGPLSILLFSWYVVSYMIWTKIWT
jgi:hypothetical protein